MSVTGRKIWRDLAHNKMRSFLVVISTAIGVFAIGLVFGLSNTMRGRMTSDHISRVPAHITIWGGPFTDATIDVVKDEAGIALAEGETELSFRWKIAGEEDWRNGNLIAHKSYTQQSMNLIDLVAGSWPSTRNLDLERQSSKYFNLLPGDSVVVSFGRGERSIPIDGVVRVPTVTPPQFGGDATFYANRDTLTWLTGVDDYNRIALRLDEFDEGAAEEAAKRIQARLERMDLNVGGYLITDPSVHWMQEIVDTLTLILVVLGILALGLGAFLIVNTINAIISQQVRQIGVMKVFGATSFRVLRLYLTMALIYGVLACLLAVPSAAYLAHRVAGFLLDWINIDNGPFVVFPLVIETQIALGIIVPLLAAFFPVVGGARLTPHQAISSYGIGSGFGKGILDRLISAIRFLPRPLTLSLRNTARRKLRLLLTLFTLALSGAMFIVVMSVGTSLNNTLEVLINELGMDVWVVFENPQHATRLVDIAESVPGVKQAEVWDQRDATINLTNGEERKILLMGLPQDSGIFKPRIVSGRRLLPGDGRAILLNNKIAVEEGYVVGDVLPLTVNGRDSEWTVVGLVINVSDNQQDCFVPLDALSRETGTMGRGKIVMVVSERKGSEAELALIASLRDAYTRSGTKPAFLTSASEIRQQSRMQFNIITYLMLAMSILAAVVGSIGLTGTMSINVVERRREIGVMRAIGANSLDVLGIFIGEGVFQGLASWLIALLLSYPSAKAFSEIVGLTLLKLPLDYVFSVDAVKLWLVIVFVLSILSSLIPGLRATRISVHDVLAYE